MMRLMLAPIRYPFAAIVGAAFAGLSMVWVPWLAHTIEPVLLPVNTDWHVTDARRDGNNLILTGTMRKRRDCVFLPPVIARDDSGQNYRLIHASPNRGSNWASSAEPQKFGPWIVEGAAGKRLTFTSVSECHSLWPTFSELGTYDARSL